MDWNDWYAVSPPLEGTEEFEPRAEGSDSKRKELSRSTGRQTVGGWERGQ